MKKYAGVTAIILFGLWVLGNFFTYIIQEKFIFFPVPLPVDHTFDLAVPFEEVILKGEHDVQVHALYIKSQAPLVKGCVIYFHGNAGNLQRWSELHTEFTSRGYNILMPDFRSFGKSTGILSEKAIYADAEMFMEWLTKECISEEIIIYGRSMGSAPAAYLASKWPVSHLILETPYSSMSSLFYTYYPFLPKIFWFKFRLETFDFLTRTDSPVTIFHGTEDTVVPLSDAMKMNSGLKTKDAFIIIEGANHHNVGTFRIYREKMDEILR
jgi:uncharacterized protein